MDTFLLKEGLARNTKEFHDYLESLIANLRGAQSNAVSCFLHYSVLCHSITAAQTSGVISPLLSSKH